MPKTSNPRQNIRSEPTDNYNPIAKINEEINSEECRRLLVKVDRMREILQMEKISLPQIVVVGDQSVGKSSILEAISGIELPRSQNICTRCPLELRLKHTPPNKKDYATIRCAAVNETVIEDLSKISDSVIECTNMLTGNSVNISSSPIYLTVYKQDIQDDLTLIDLPGIVRAQVSGQSPTVCQDIISLIDICVKPDSAIVVHVIPSDVDFATSGSIQICQRYDPTYERQIIAVSKIDKHDKGIGEKLQGIGSGAIALSLGCVAVLNRKQEEIDENISFAEMRRREEEFFRTNSAFANVPQEYLGSGQLIKKLVSIQQRRIRLILPMVIEQVKHKMKTSEEELKRMPPAVLTENHARVAFHDILRSYRTVVERSIKGEYEINTERRTQMFDPHSCEKWDERIAFHLKMIENYTSNEIRKIFSQFSSQNQYDLSLKIIDENYGGGLPNFPSSNIIEQLYQPYHRQLEKPCKDLVNWVEGYMIKCLEYILAAVLPAEAGYKKVLGYEIMKIIKEVIGKSKEKCMESVEHMLRMEEKVFTVNPHYMAIFNKLKNDETQVATSKKVITTPNNNNNVAAHDVLLGLQAYCAIVQSRITDHLSQLCYYWFVRNGVLILDDKLHTAFTPIELLRLMKELPALEQKRNSLRRCIETMQKALAAAVDDIND